MRTIGLILWSLTLLSACGSETQENPDAGASTELEVDVLHLQEKKLGAFVTIRGVVESRIDIEMSAEREGRVTLRPVEESDPVKAGDLLLQLDDERAGLERDRAKAALDEAQLQPNTDAALLRTRTLELKMAEEALARCRIEAPAGGTLDRVHVEVGEWVRRGDRVLRIVDRRQLRAVFELNEEQRLNAVIGDEIVCTPSKRRDLEVRGRLVRMAVAADETTGRFRAEVEFNDVPEEILPGMVVEGRMALGADRLGLMLPKKALMRRFEQWICYRVDTKGSLTAAREVGLSVRPVPGQPAYLEISAGLAAGDRVILGPLIGLRDGTPVRISEGSRR